MPSILFQTKWPHADIDFFEFKERETYTEYYNPGLVEIDGVRFLIARRTRGRDIPHQIVQSDFEVFRLDKLNPVDGFVLNLRRQSPDQQYEDARAVFHGDKIYLCYTTMLRPRDKRNTWGHTEVSVLDKHWNVLNTYSPEFARNGRDLLRNQGCEKNWMWFFHAGHPTMIYTSVPHIVAEFNQDFVFRYAYGSHTESLWRHGEIRGGTPPVMVNDEYWTFFHSSLVEDDHKRYYMGAYAFQTTPPFRITRMTPNPILSGSPQDPMPEGKKSAVVFPCGCLFEHGGFFVTLGVNDLNCAWIRIPHDDLLKITVAV